MVVALRKCSKEEKIFLNVGCSIREQKEKEVF
jgi:hypothetical protein